MVIATTSAPSSDVSSVVAASVATTVDVAMRLPGNRVTKYAERSLSTIIMHVSVPTVNTVNHLAYGPLKVFKCYGLRVLYTYE